MAMEAVLKQLESRIEDLVKAYGEARKREAELTAKLEKLEGQLASNTDLGTQVEGLEKQRDELATRLEKVLKVIDSTLAASD
jgi:chaperonin cofactor prefoldin